MAKNSLDQWSATPDDNSDIAGVNIAEGCPPSGINNAIRTVMAQIKAFLPVPANDAAGVNTVGGTATAITITTTRPYTAYSSALYLTFKAAAASTGVTTINVDNVGVKALKKITSNGEVNIEAGNLVPGAFYTMVYRASADSGSGAFILLNPTNTDLEQVGDGRYSLRNLGSKYLKRDGGIYLIANYPDLAALLPPLPDTVLWSSVTSGTSSAIRGIKYAAGKYVLVGAGGLILVSTDLVNFSIKSSGTVQDLTAIEYGNGVWVAIAQNGTVCVSSDAETWSTTSIGGSFAALSITFGNSLFVVGGAISNVSAIVTSANGTTWSANKLGGGVLGGGVFSLSWNGSLFLGGCQGTGVNNVAFRSSDGDTWNSAVTGASFPFRSIANDGTTFVMVGDNGTILTTTNGTSFTARTSGVTTTLNAVAYSAPIGWMVVGNSGLALISSNLSSWVVGGAIGTTAALNAVLADPNTSGLYLVGGAGGLLRKGQRTLPTQFQLPNDGANEWIRALA